MIPERALWRVGYQLDPAGFAPPDLYAFNHRFDDVHGRFRTLYCAEFQETSLREVLADFRPNLAAMRRHVERYGREAADDFVAAPVTAQWRRQHVLARVTLHLDGALVELAAEPVPLTDPAPEALLNVAAGWRLELEPAPASVPG